MFCKLPNSVGMGPESRLYSTVWNVRGKKDKKYYIMAKGRMELAKQENSRFKSGRTLPVDDGFDLLKSNACTFIIDPTSVGIEPVNLLSFNSSCSSLDSFAS